MTQSPPAAPQGPLHRYGRLLVAAIIVGTVFLAFSGTIRSSFTGWDDEVYVYKNSRIRSLDPQSITWFFTHSFFASYTPLALLSHAVDYRLWGNDPRGHHLTGILLHAANAVWLFLLALQLFPLILRRNAGPELFGAAVASLLFALHPLRVESIASVADRKDLLCAFFLVPSVIAYLFYSRARGARVGKRWYAGALVLFALALLSKSVALTLPVLLLVVDFVLLPPGGGRALWSGLLKEKIPFFLLSLAAGIAALMTAPMAFESSTLSTLSAFDKRLLPWYNIAFYPLKTIWPDKLSLLYEYEPATFVALAVIGCAVTAILVALFFRRWRLIPAGWIWYVVLLLPTSGIVLSGIQPTADRYSYLPTMVFFVIGGVAVLKTWALARTRLMRGMLLTLVACLLGLSVLLTTRQIGFWRDAETLWTHAQSVAPGSPEPWYDLGLALQDRGDFERAMECYVRALKIRPDYPEVFVNLGNIHRAKGDTTRAIASYRRALELQPSYVLASNDLAGILLAGGKSDEAIAAYQKSLAIDPGSAGAMYGLGLAYRAKGDTLKAIEALQKLTAMNPSHGQALFVLGLVLLDHGEKEEALECLRRAARLHHPEAERILTERNIDW